MHWPLGTKGEIVGASEPVIVYFDYACPYVNAAAKWVHDLKQRLGDEQVTFDWRFFPLEQVNAPEDSEEKVWNLPPENRSQARNSMHAGAAALRQGKDKFDAFNLALLTMKHDEKLDHGKSATIDEAATRAGLDLEQFHRDLQDRSLLNKIRDDYTEGREEHGVFGTPTFVFPNGTAAYLQVLPPPLGDEAVAFWESFRNDVEERPYLREIKRPRKG